MLARVSGINAHPAVRKNGCVRLCLAYPASKGWGCLFRSRREKKAFEHSRTGRGIAARMAITRNASPVARFLCQIGAERKVCLLGPPSPAQIVGSDDSTGSLSRGERATRAGSTHKLKAGRPSGVRFILTPRSAKIGRYELCTEGRAPRGGTAFGIHRSFDRILRSLWLRPSRR